jgi:spermidine/putrescine transport system permease protein
VDSRTDHRRAWSLVLPTWALLGMFLLVPLGIILMTSFAPRGAYGGTAPVENIWNHVASGAFLYNYAQTFSMVHAKIFWRSLWMAVTTTGLCLLISYPAAYYIAIVAPARRRGLLLALTVIPFWTSFLVRTYAWRFILYAEGLVNTSLTSAGVIDEPMGLLYTQGAVLVGLVYGELPFMILPLYASLEKLDPSLLEAAADLGAGRWETFWRVTVPATAPGIAAGTLLVFVPSVGQFVVSDLLGGARSSLVGNVINDQFRGMQNNPPLGSAIAVELTVVVLALLTLYRAYMKRHAGEDVL